LGDIESIRFLQQKINELQNENGTYIRWYSTCSGIFEY
jgi:hypothetical protein